GSQSSPEINKAVGQYFEDAYLYFDKNSHSWVSIQKHFGVGAAEVSEVHDGTLWPLFFQDYIKDFRFGAATKTATSLLKGKSPYKKGWSEDHVRLACIGDKIRKRAVEIKSIMTSVYVPLFVPSSQLKSGKTQEQLFRAIRKSMWPVQAAKHADDFAKSKRQRQKTAGLPWTEEQDKAWFQTRVELNFRTLDHHWYPDHWLVFVNYSLPAGDYCLPSLNGGAFHWKQGSAAQNRTAR
ncbi:hypothetical protein B484DRAFT_407379, partial [Ochromonadaceae sp. CCMP2298]